MGEKAMNCRRFRKQYIDLLLPADDDAKSAELKSHIETCPSCARYFAEMNQTLAVLQPSQQVVSSSQFKERVMHRIKEPVMHGNFHADTKNIIPHAAGRGFFSGLFRQVAMASAFVAALVYVVLLLFGDLLHFHQAYSLDQTLEANRNIRFVHMKAEYDKKVEEEMWAQFNEKGQLIHLLVDYPETEDGHKTVHWMPDNKVQVWFRTKNAINTAAEKDTLGQMKRIFERFDPKPMMEKVDKGVKEGKLQLEQQPATGKDETITLIVTNKDSKFQRTVYKVDQKSKFVKEVEKYEFWDEKYELVGRISYSDYNNPTGPEVFTFKPRADAIIIDETTQVIGLAKGDLSDKEIAVKVVREFFEALIAKDYAKAGMLFGGIPASFFEKRMENVKFLRIVSIGEPIPGPEGTGSLKVPCKIEIETDGKKSIMEPYGPFVRPVHSQRDRWAISGGI
jgi:hypothetical protein